MFLVTYRDRHYTCDTAREAAVCMAELWVCEGPDPDIRTDRLVGGEIIVPISSFDRAEIEVHVRALAFIRRNKRHRQGE
jgi:hypothetical protein